MSKYVDKDGNPIEFRPLPGGQVVEWVWDEAEEVEPVDPPRHPDDCPPYLVDSHYPIRMIGRPPKRGKVE